MSDPLQALVRSGQPAWLVGGAVRDRLLGRDTSDYDVVVAGTVGPVARSVGREASGHAFELSEAFGAWRVVARDHSWQVDLIGLGDGTIEEDLGRRDLTVNAIAQRLGADGWVDPYGGTTDLRRRELRMVSEHAFADDPLRTLRAARLACELGFTLDASTLEQARASASELANVAPERTFAELKRLICASRAVEGLELMDRLGVTPAILPELTALGGVAQSRFHHLDVLGHTRGALAETIALEDDPCRICRSPGQARELERVLAQPLADELTRGQALRFGALLHDIAKPVTRDVTAEGRITFMGHDVAGATMASAILGRLRASERLRAHVAALVRHHLRLGFLVHRMPLDRRTVYDYLLACSPVAVDVTLLSVADRLATRGDDAERAIARHLQLAGQLLDDALAWEADPPRPPVRGDELARALGLAPGPRIGDLLAELRAAAFAGELTGREQAIEHARGLIVRCAHRSSMRPG